MVTLALIHDRQAELQTQFGNELLIIANVSQTQFSIARHFGGIKFNGSEFKYFPADDLLVRQDVVKFLTKKPRKAKQ
jgi:hypothetical protein